MRDSPASSPVMVFYLSTRRCEPHVAKSPCEKASAHSTMSAACALIEIRLFGPQRQRTMPSRTSLMTPRRSKPLNRHAFTSWPSAPQPQPLFSTLSPLRPLPVRGTKTSPHRIFVKPFLQAYTAKLVEVGASVTAEVWRKRRFASTTFDDCFVGT